MKEEWGGRDGGGVGMEGGIEEEWGWSGDGGGMGRKGGNLELGVETSKIAVTMRYHPIRVTRNTSPNTQLVQLRGRDYYN